eukprot:510638_1
MEDLRGSIKTWSLESDDRLLRALSTFSAKISERTREVNDNLETLGEETRSAQSQLQNTFNRFLMLQSGQFIENRVVRQTGAAKQAAEEKKREEDEKKNNQSETNGNTQTGAMNQTSAAAIIDTYKKALNLGMAAMEYTVPQSLLASSLKSQQDSIEAGILPDLPKSAKDQYNNKPLPYIIGTPEFSKHDDLGLFGAFGDTVFYGIEEENEDEVEDEDDEDGSSEGEDYDFMWMKEYTDVLLPKFEDYYEPESHRFYREDLMNFFPDAEEEQIDDILEYFEDENQSEEDENGDFVNVTQLIILLNESQKAPGDADADGQHKKKKRQSAKRISSSFE